MSVAPLKMSVQLRFRWADIPFFIMFWMPDQVRHDVSYTSKEVTPKQGDFLNLNISLEAGVSRFLRVHQL
jgi:hypothetical protein